MDDIQRMRRKSSDVVITEETRSVTCIRVLERLHIVNIHNLSVTLWRRAAGTVSSSRGAGSSFFLAYRSMPGYSFMWPEKEPLRSLRHVISRLIHCAPYSEIYRLAGRFNCSWFSLILLVFCFGQPEPRGLRKRAWTTSAMSSGQAKESLYR